MKDIWMTVQNLIQRQIVICKKTKLCYNDEAYHLVVIVLNHCNIYEFFLSKVAINAATYHIFDLIDTVLTIFRNFDTVNPLSPLALHS